MFPIDTQTRAGIAAVGQAPMIFHCNHYNTYLQRTILDPDYVDCRPMLVDAATSVAHPQLVQLMAGVAPGALQARLALAAQVFAWAGFGLLDFSGVSESGGVVRAASSHYSMAWKNKFGAASEPMAFFDAGFVAAAVAAACGQPAGAFRATQVACIAQGAAANEYRVEPSPGRAVFASPAWPSNQSNIPGRAFATPVDENAIVSALSQMPIVGNEEGLIPAFGVVLTRMYADYYNRISFEFERAIEAATGESSLGSLLLVEAGHNCAFNTFGGIMQSDEWYGLIEPMCKTRDDWVHGIVAVVNALGWGVWRVADFEPGKRLVIRIYNGYESAGYLAMYGQSKAAHSYLATGGTAGIMNLLYHIDITQRPALTADFYDASFSTAGTFAARQTKAREQGDAYDEFVAERE